MKSVGEVMAIGRTFQESLQKALRGLETGIDGFNPVMKSVETEEDWAKLKHELRMAGSRRLWYVGDAFRHGLTLEEVGELTAIDPWFLAQIKELIDIEKQVVAMGPEALMPTELRKLKRRGFSDRRIADLIGVKEKIVRTARHKENIRPVFKRVDSCAAEFASNTAYLYSTYEEFCEANPTDRQKIMILGGGPNRIGQGIEFDYCCVHASFALKEAGYETIMVNCNPETVSTDYDSSDRLYFEPVTLEDVLEIVHKEKPKGVIVQYGGQTPLKLARALEEAGVPIIGTSPDSIDLAEDRERFQQLVTRLEAQAAAEPDGAQRRGSRRDGARRSAIRSSCGRRTSSAAGPWRSCTARTSCATTSIAPSASRTTARSCSTVFSISPSRSTSMRFATARKSSSAASWSTSSRPASTPATRAARCRRSA